MCRLKLGFCLTVCGCSCDSVNAQNTRCGPSAISAALMSSCPHDQTSALQQRCGDRTESDICCSLSAMSRLCVCEKPFPHQPIPTTQRCSTQRTAPHHGLLKTQSLALTTPAHCLCPPRALDSDHCTHTPRAAVSSLRR